MANFCRNCGGELNGANFCAKCGAQNDVQTINQGVTQVVNQSIMNQSLPKDNYAVSAFVCGLIGFLCCSSVSIPGLILSIISLSNKSKGKVEQKNKWMSIVGLVLSILGIALMIINIVGITNGTNDVYNDIINIING